VSGPNARTISDAPSGILTAPVTPGHPWDAVRALRDGLRELRHSGASPHVEFLLGFGEDGRLSRLGTASLIVLGYEV
jgi:hypothetical protein